ncbi:MAG TPA: hypothetical protein VK698_38295 [Kofleriaceae bacterium]|nr:hypothetical protein [Kofleriaceae bacterium]
MEACGPSAAAASISGHVEGELSLLGWTGTVALSVDWQLDGLQDEAVAVAGSFDLELTSEFEDWSIEYERTRSDDDTVVRFGFTASATFEDGQATVTIGGVRFLIDLDAGSMTRPWIPWRRHRRFANTSLAAAW